MVRLTRTTPIPYNVGDLHWHSVKGLPIGLYAYRVTGVVDII